MIMLQAAYGRLEELPTRQETTSWTDDWPKRKNHHELMGHRLKGHQYRFYASFSQFQAGLW